MRFAEKQVFHKRIAWQSLAKLVKKTKKSSRLCSIIKWNCIFVLSHWVKHHKSGIYAIYPMFYRNGLNRPTVNSHQRWLQLTCGRTRVQ